MNDQLEHYIKMHKVSSADFLVFQNWEGFLSILFSNNGHVDMIVWYEYCKINEQKIGMGGYRDEKHLGYMWAETPFFETDLRQKSYEDIRAYIIDMKEKYTNFNLYPEFYIS